MVKVGIISTGNMGQYPFEKHCWPRFFSLQRSIKNALGRFLFSILQDKALEKNKNICYNEFIKMNLMNIEKWIMKN